VRLIDSGWSQELIAASALATIRFMPIDAGPLPDDVHTLRRMLVAEREAHAARETELAAAKAGLVTKTLEIEKLKIQIARLRRQQFGSSGVPREKIDRIIAQRPRPRNLPARCPRPHCRPPDQPHHRIAALEHRHHPSARCRLTRSRQAPSP
jgi:hypothetical protein